MNPEITARVLTRNRASAWNLPNSSGRSWQDQLNDAGTAALVNPNDDAVTAQLQLGRIVEFSLAGTPCFACLIETTDRLSVAASEESAEVTKVNGRGTAAILDEGIVGPLPGYIIADTRHWNFATPQLADGTWVAPVVTAFNNFPPGWPDLGAQWVWDRNALVTGIPAGDVYFRKAFTTAADKSVQVWCVADDGYEVWLDGVKLFEDTLYNAAWTGQARNDHYSLAAGNHVLAVHARNNNTLLAGMRCTCIEVDGAGTMIGVLAHTDATWKMLAYPAQPPGFTVGRILGLLLAEAQARGALTDVTRSFSDTVDTAGVAWPNTWDVSVPVGQGLLAVLRALAETYLDFAMGVSANVLSAWVTRGGATAVALSAGTNLTELRHTGK